MKLHYLRILVLSLLCIGIGRLQAQKINSDPTGDAKWAKAYLSVGDFVSALKEYQLLIKKDSANPEYNYNLATCYLNTNIDKSKALPYLQFASTQPKMDPIVFYDLGRAYQIVNRFDEAIEAFRKYKSIVNGPDMNYIPADLQIEMCERAKEMVQNPVNVTFENMGARINSPSPDYSPYISKYEDLLHFTSKRAGNVGNLVDFDGYYTADLFFVEKVNGNWEKSKRLANTINTPLIEEMAGVSDDGNYLFAYVDNLDYRYQVLMGVRTGKSFQYFQPMGPNVNPKGEGATAVTIFNDKKTVIFAAERMGGLGNSDLWISKVLPNGSWGPPVNMGPSINTELDEDYPHLSADNKRLYFSSVGHNSMGGFDLYYSDWDSVSGQWSKPVNLGYPVNTPDDNVQISFTASGRYAYLSALRPEGYGNLDIYRVIFNDVEPPYTIFSGSLVTSDSVSIIQNYRKGIQFTIDTLTTSIDSIALILKHLTIAEVNAVKEKIEKLRSQLDSGPKAKILVTNAASNALYGTYLPNPSTGKYTMILPPGEYSVSVECEGYEQLKTSLTLPDEESLMKEVHQNFVLKH
jgi:tetratricopeptide (TPR) repeat protein